MSAAASRSRLAVVLPSAPRGRRGRGAAVVCAALLVMSASARAQAHAALAPAASAASAGAERDAEDLRAWLTRIHEAARRSNYAGTLVNSAGGTVVSSRVAHYCEGRTELERIDALDGETRGMLRVNGEVRTVWPRLRVAVVEPIDPRASFPSLVSGSEQRIPEFYEMRLQTPDRIAGRDADRLLLKARNADRFDHLLWSDHATGLLLRADVQVGGRTLESSAFSEVRIGVRPQPDAIYAELHRAGGYHVLKPTIQPTTLESEGWSMRASLLPGGFVSLGCVRRALPLASADGGEAKVLQSIYSDGITHVSLFAEPFQPQRHKGGGLTVMGATHTLARRVGDDWVTAVGDVPPATLERFIAALRRKP